MTNLIRVPLPLAFNVRRGLPTNHAIFVRTEEEAAEVLANAAAYIEQRRWKLTRSSTARGDTVLYYTDRAEAFQAWSRMFNYNMREAPVSLIAHVTRENYAHFMVAGNEKRRKYRYSVTVELDD